MLNKIHEFRFSYIKITTIIIKMPTITTTPAGFFSFPTPPHTPRHPSLSSPCLSLSSRPPLRLTSATAGSSGGGDGSNNNGRITGGGGGGGGRGKGRGRKRYEPVILYKHGNLADEVIELYDRVHVDISYACIVSLAYIFAFLGIVDIFLHVIGFHAYCEEIEKEKANKKCKCCNASYGKAVGGSM